MKVSTSLCVLAVLATVNTVFGRTVIESVGIDKRDDEDEGITVADLPQGLSNFTDIIGSLLPRPAPAFTGFNTGIASWYRANEPLDSTNGHSWCGYPYSNWTPGFAPNVSAMLEKFHFNYEAAAEAFCGLEALVTTADGHSAILYIVDGFDPWWVKTPGSIDVLKYPWSFLAGEIAHDKNHVLPVTWEFTGRRSTGLSFKNTGLPFP